MVRWAREDECLATSSLASTACKGPELLFARAAPPLSIDCASPEGEDCLAASVVVEV